MHTYDVKIESSAQLVLHADYGCVCVQNLVISFGLIKFHKDLRSNVFTGVLKIYKDEKRVRKLKKN